MKVFGKAIVPLLYWVHQCTAIIIDGEVDALYICLTGGTMLTKLQIMAIAVSNISHDVA